ncbi:MAG: FMN-binding protein [Bdellovibrionales bacterium]
MNFKPYAQATFLIPIAAGFTQPASGAETYLSLEQAQNVLLPQKTLSEVVLALPEVTRALVAQESGVRWPKIQPRLWRSNEDDWFILDRVLGKHEDILYAMAIDKSGKVLGIEILEYRESYGDEVRDAKWREQFVGKNSVESIQFNQSIKNISGATLSCRHLAEGAKRLLSLYQHMLKNYDPAKQNP